MEGHEQPSATLIGAIRGLGITLLRLLHTRLELLGVELKEEKSRVTAVLLSVGAVLFFCVMTVVCLTITVVLFCPAEARPYVLLGFCLVYAGLAIGFGCKLKRELQDKPPPLAASVDELKKDVEWLRSKS